MQPEPAAVALQMETFISDLLPDVKNEMTWNIGNYGFEMKLSANVPEAIRTGLTPLISALIKKAGETGIDYYAIHPGGKKILKVVENALNISKVDNHHSHQVLRDYGNMSSPTILFVFKRIIDGLVKEDKNKLLLGFGFGPGLTLESMIAKIHLQ